MRFNPEYQRLVLFEIRRIWNKQNNKLPCKPCPFEHLDIPELSSWEEIDDAWKRKFTELCPGRERDISDLEYAGAVNPADISAEQLQKAIMLEDARDYAQYVMIETAPRKPFAPDEESLHEAWKKKVSKADPTGRLDLKDCPFAQLGLERSADFGTIETVWHKARNSLRPTPWAYVDSDDMVRFNIINDARDFAVSILNEKARTQRTELYQASEVRRVMLQAVCSIIHREAQARFGAAWTHREPFPGEEFSPETLIAAEDMVRNGTRPARNARPQKPHTPGAFAAYQRLVLRELIGCFHEYNATARDTHETPEDQAAAVHLLHYGLPSDTEELTQLVSRLDLGRPKAHAVTTFLLTHTVASPGSFTPSTVFMQRFQATGQPVPSRRAFFAQLRDEVKILFPHATAARIGSIHGYVGIAAKHHPPRSNRSSVIE